jgi:carboxyl-terminal processing protease
MATFHRAVGCAILALAAVVAGCGGSGGDAASGGGGPPLANGGWRAGSFLPASSFAGKCVNPRSGTDPQSGLPYNEIAGTATDENNFLRSWSNDFYLWYNEIVDRDPGQYTTPEYFNLLKTTATTTSGAPKDKFHFTYSTADWLNLSQSGVEAGYGALWAVAANLPPRRIVVAYTEPGSPARSSAAFTRGAEVLRIDGVDVVNSNTQADVDVFVAGLYPDSTGEQHTFLTRDRFGNQRTVVLTSTAVTKTPVPVSNVINFNGGRVGYLLFNDHILTAEQPLITAIEQMRSALVNDLVLDLRYNGGGYLFLASQLAYMIAGDARTSGQTFEKLQFNDKHPSIDPVTGQALTPMPFLNTSSSNQALPSLNLSRVFVLTGGTTCSASESIINALRGVGVQVIQIGSTTCGKPYGFYPQPNCGTTYFSIQFRGVNAANFGDYTDGFAPSNAPGVGGTRVAGEGCSVADDFNDELGAVTEDRLSAALNYTVAPSCPAPTGLKPSFTKPANDASVEDLDVLVRKSPLLMNRILEAP